MAAELGGYMQTHTSPSPLTMGNSRVVKSPSSLKECGSRAQAMRRGSFPASEVMFHVPKASFRVQESGRRGPRLRLPPDPLCTGPLRLFLQVVKWSRAYQQGVGLTLGEEVEQCNAFLSRIAVTTKHMSKAGRTDMLTLMAMRWNQQKFNNLAASLSCRYQKATKRLESQLQDLESMRIQLAVTQVEIEGWVTGIKEWAEATTSQKNADLDAVTSRMEVLVASIKRRSQRLYKDTDGSKDRARIRRKIREEKAILSSVVEKYNSMVPDTERIVFDIILSDETVWPWQLSHGDAVDLKTKRKAFDVVMAIRRLEEKKIVLSEMAKHWKSLSTRADTLKEMSSQLSSEALQSELWALNEEGIKDFLSLTLRKKQEVTRMMKHARDCYAQVLTGTSMDFQNDWDGYDSDSELSD
ncbi:uncharacterized protein LOC130084492 [Rhinichthys klamathensis goyatoka]|uniref:uncharacterized protein LOC130084492 n=1 Tax=Rhinichthys klamathensis goyatoka TaxID=3034132 RepID=UPI0024B55BE8|nr:uncharacterized protein LOC130084492 [Rhinichthys klamathensis goyatoka]